MSDIVKAMQEAVAIAKGETPAARIHHQGHTYVPEAELTTLRAEVEKLTNLYHTGVEYLKATDAALTLTRDELATLRATNERLRAALERISSYTSNPEGSGPAYTYCGKMVRIARAALAQEGRE